MNGETKYKYTYAGNGDLYSIEDIDSDIKFCYNYDSLDRLISSYQLIGSNITLLTQYDYDNENRVSVYHCGIEGAAGGTLGHTYSYTYNSNDGNLSKISVTGNNIYGDNLVYTYDNLKRLSKKSITGQYRTLAQEYGYRNISSTRTTLQIQNLTWTLQGTTTLAYSYTYDAIGNITEIRKDGSLVALYTYDSQSQLKSETLYDQDLFYTYNYDSYGNIRSVYKRQYSTNALINYESYDYNDSSWLDKLTSYNGTGITYDSIGNPLSYYNGGSYSFTWTSGRKLQTSSDNGVNSFYAYNADGQRIKKICSGTIYNYYYSDGALVRQTGGGNTIDFLYDENGSVYSIVYNGTQYYLVKNLQGDVTQIRSVYGTVLVEYAYDAWGNVLDISGTYASTLGQNNPIRYRGYYYDSETSLYYLNSRYYDPAMRRFINADDIDFLGTDEGLLSYNLFAYCLNDPVNRTDDSGNLSIKNWIKIGVGAIALGAAIALTVATGGGAAAVAIGVAKVVGSVALSTATSAGIGYLTNGKEGAIDGACNGFMLGSLSACGGAAIKYGQAVRAAKAADPLNKALEQLDASGLRPGQTEISRSRVMNLVNDFDSVKAQSSIYSNGGVRYLVDGHHTTVASTILGKGTCVNMGTVTSQLPSATNIYWAKKWYQFGRTVIKVIK